MIKNTIIRNDDNFIKYVIHLSDIHIRQYGREIEYKQVFNKLYNKLKYKNYNNDNSVIVITGDIVHDKSLLTGNSIEIVKLFFSKLSEITSIICILGNHDLNINQKNGIDSITPVICNKFISNNPIRVLQHNGKYKYNNIVFGVTNIFADIITPCKKSKKYTSIGLYHGILNKATVCNGMQMNSGKFKISDFKKNYDFTLLGDIHKRQYLDKNKTIWYAGSLIQQNRGESIYNHGYVVLNLKTGKSTFHNIINDYGMVDLIINDDGSTNHILKELPKNADIKIICKAKNKDLINDIYNKIEDEGVNIIQKSQMIDNSDYDINVKLKDGSEHNLLNVMNKKNLLTLFKNHMTNIIEDKIIQDRVLKKIDKKLNKLNIDKKSSGRQIKIKNIEFNNLFRYKNKNVIVFDDFRGIIGILGECNAGKSSLIDILLFVIFGTSLRSPKVNMINTSSNKFYSKVELSVNNINYMIERKGNKAFRKDSSIYMRNETCTVYKNKKNISQNDIISTNKYIQKEICTMDEFIFTSIIFQNKVNTFMEMKKNDKKNLLCKLARVDIFNDILSEEKTNNTILIRERAKINKKINSIIQVNKKTNINGEIGELNDCTKEQKKNLDDLNKVLENNIFKQKQLQDSLLGINIKLQMNDVNKLNNLHKNNKFIDYDKDDIDDKIKSLQNKNRKLVKKLLSDEECKELLKIFNESNNILIKKHQKEIKKLYGDIVKIKDTNINNYSYNKCEELIKEYNIEINKLNKKLKIKNKDKFIVQYDKKIKTLKQIKNKIKTLLPLLKSVKKEYEKYKFDDNCDFCVNNSKIINYNNIKDEYDNFIEKQKTIDKWLKKEKLNYQNINKLYDLQNKLVVLNDVINNYNLYDKIEKLQNKIKNLINAKCAEYSTVINVKDKYYNNISKIKELEDILNIYDIKDDIDDMILNRRLIEEKLKELINNTNIDIDERDSIKLNYEENISKLKLLQELNEELIECNINIEDSNIILKMLNSSDGIVENILTKNILPKLETIMNNIIFNVEHNSIKIEYCKDDIYFYNVDNGTKTLLKMNGGYVNHMYNIILMVALAQINNNIQTNFVIIDEAFDNCSASGKNNMLKLIENIKAIYDFMMIISHDDNIKSIFNAKLNIIRDGTSSKINYEEN